MDLVSGSSTRIGRDGNIRPHLCTLLRNNSESDLIIVEADPSDLAEGGEGCRELCGRNQLMTPCRRCLVALLVKVEIFLMELLNRIARDGGVRKMQLGFVLDLDKAIQRQ